MAFFDFLKSPVRTCLNESTGQLILVQGIPKSLKSGQKIAAKYLVTTPNDYPESNWYYVSNPQEFETNSLFKIL